MPIHGVRDITISGPAAVDPAPLPPPRTGSFFGGPHPTTRTTAHASLVTAFIGLTLAPVRTGCQRAIDPARASHHSLDMRLAAACVVLWIAGCTEHGSGGGPGTMCEGVACGANEFCDFGRNGCGNL